MIARFLVDDSGQGLVEYALIVALVAMAVIGAMQMLGTKGNSSIGNAAGSLS
jgi:pilus assembly protein Flp/PilA